MMICDNERGFHHGWITHDRHDMAQALSDKLLIMQSPRPIRSHLEQVAHQVGHRLMLQLVALFPATH